MLFRKKVTSSFFQLLVTANVVLESGQDMAGPSTYTVFYGQVFSALRKREDKKQLNQEDTLIYEPMSVRDASDVNNVFPEKIDMARVVERFSLALSDDSNVRVHSVINVCVLFVALKGLRRSQRLGRYPRVLQES